MNSCFTKGINFNLLLLAKNLSLSMRFIQKPWAHLGKATSCPHDGLLIQRETVKHKEHLWALSLENTCIKNNSLPPSFFHSDDFHSGVNALSHPNMHWELLDTGLKPGEKPTGVASGCKWLKQHCSKDQASQVTVALGREPTAVLWHSQLVFFVSPALGNEGTGALFFSPAETSMPWVVCMKLSPAVKSLCGLFTLT